jgi:hypothetical protein
MRIEPQPKPQPKPQQAGSASPDGAPAESGTAVFDVLAEALRATEERAEMRRRSPGKSESELEQELCSPELGGKLRVVVRAYEIEQSIALLPFLVHGARHSKSANLRILYAIAFFEALKVLKSEPGQGDTDPMRAASRALLPALLERIRDIKDNPDPVGAADEA